MRIEDLAYRSVDTFKLSCPYRKVHGNGLLGFSMEAALRLVGLREAESGGGQVQGSARAQKRDREFSSGVHTSLQ